MVDCATPLTSDDHDLAASRLFANGVQDVSLCFNGLGAMVLVQPLQVLVSTADASSVGTVCAVLSQSSGRALASEQTDQDQG